MAVWMVRAGVEGGEEEVALERGLAVIGWVDVPDLSTFDTESELDEAMSGIYPDATLPSIRAQRSQLWAFSKLIQPGDLVVLPLRTTGEIAIGKVAGGYEHHPELGAGMSHARPVEWLVTDFPRSSFQQDLLYTLGSLRTVCRVQRNNAEERIQAVLAGKPDPGPPGEEQSAPIEDLEQAARDRITQHIAEEFPDKGMERLVEGVLIAMGYHTERKESGSQDRGADVLASADELGFGAPRICVQVKHQQAKVGEPVVDQLLGAMSKFQAEHGLFVAWNGFTKPVRQMAREKHFQIRFWTQKDLVDHILQYYDRIPDELRERLALRRIWTLEQEQEEKLASSAE